MTKNILLAILLLIAPPLPAQDKECPAPTKSNESLDNLEIEMGKITPKNGGGPPDIKIRMVNYPRNAEADYCLRSMLIADTIVFHHSASPETDTAETINAYHLQRGTDGKPWHMIAYHYAINAPYEGDPNTSQVQVTEGRPLEMVGAHAGGDAFTSNLSPGTKKVIEKTGITCGKLGGTFEPKKDIFNSAGQTKINNISVGIVLIGNYSPFAINNPSGYPTDKPRYPTFAFLELAARLSCHLQRNNPALKKITYHGKFRETSCPGLVKERMNIIKNIAEKYGCLFEIQ